MNKVNKDTFWRLPVTLVTLASCRLNGGISTFPSRLRVSRVTIAVLLVRNCISVRKPK